MNNAVLDKSKSFSVRIVKLQQYLINDKKEYIISKQLLRSGTSIGANITEGQYSISNKDFLNKFQIALKECYETEYWLELLFKTDYLTQKQFYSIYNDCKEIRYLLISITQSVKKKIESENGK